MFWHDIRSPRAFAGSWVVIARPQEHPGGPRGLQQRLAAWSPNLENQAKTKMQGINHAYDELMKRTA